MKERIAYTLIIFQLLTPLAARAAVVAPDRYRMGITHWGPLSHSEERAYQHLERRLQRWLENLPSANIGAESVSAVLSQPVEESEGIPRQRELFKRAIASWKGGQTDVARQQMRQAVALHPDRQSPGLDGWEEETDSFSLTAFEHEVELQSKSIRPICRLELDDKAASEFRINGFSLGSRRSAWLGPGEYRIRAVGKSVREQPYVCEREGRSRVAFSTSSPLVSTNPSDPGLESVSRAHRMSSLFVLKPEKGFFKLLLFTPGVALDEIPTSRPLLAEAESDGRPLPVATDAFLQLFEKHRTKSLVALADGDLLPVRASLGAMGEKLDKTQWYNNWKFWTVLGGAASAVAVAYLATRHDSVKSQGGWVSVKME